MTRCIHCTRCVRFGQEIEGLQELGTIGRAEDMKIGMYIEKSVDHELSANIIDICPVGALNNKPYRYSARAWEMQQRPTVSPHDCVGSNMNVHILRGRIKRIVPRENEEINETWLSDRDRFGFEGIYSDDRLLRPRVKKDGTWQDVDWEDALEILAEKLQHADKTGILASPGATLEEGHLLARLADHMGTANIDHRIRQRDFSDQDNDPLFPWVGCGIAELETRDAILVVGSNLRKEAPIIAHRVRKAALAGAKVSFVNNDSYEYHFAVEENIHEGGLVAQLAGIAVAAAGRKKPSKAIAALVEGVKANDVHKRIAASLADAEQAHIVLGLVAGRHRASSALRALAAAISDLTGATFGVLSEGANSAGASLAGVLPHRSAGADARKTAGLNAADMLDESLDAVLLFGIDPEHDVCCTDDAISKLAAQNFVAAFTAYDSDALQDAADLLLPIGTFAESAGTFVNCEGRWQSFNGVAEPVGEARPGWKVLRVLGNLLDAENFDYQTSEDVRDELGDTLGDVEPDNQYAGTNALGKVNGADDPDAQIDIPIYSSDATVRRATALQLTPEAQRNAGGGG
jgi:NADH-quinone oxidoreductase subunit G